MTFRKRLSSKQREDEHTHVGSRYGILTVIEPAGALKNGSRRRTPAWLCRCDCGKTRIAAGVELRRKRIVSCGCQSQHAFKDLSGLQFGRLTVTKRVPTVQGTVWECRCVCGVARRVQATHLQTGASKSCGCLADEVRGDARREHGLSNTPEYMTWNRIKDRCHNPNTPSFRYYGGRGIVVCQQWRESFSAFLEHMGPRPSPRHSIDRVDFNGNYEPGNCRWATSKQQGRNTRRNHYVIVDGQRMTLIEASELTGVNYGTLKWRIRKGQSIEQATGRRP